MRITEITRITHLEKQKFLVAFVIRRVVIAFIFHHFDYYLSVYVCASRNELTFSVNKFGILHSEWTKIGDRSVVTRCRPYV